MPGPNSRPNGTVRHTSQMVPKGLADRIASWEKTEQSKPTPKTKHHKPGSQKK